MKTLITAALLLMVPGIAAAEFDAADIARLPQDQVAIAKKHCAKVWTEEFRMRLWCEDKEFESMKKLIDRGSMDKTSN
jgi:hypothetical protein